MLKILVILAILTTILLPTNGWCEQSDDLLWLSLNIYHEARSEPIIGELAVAFVTLNRVENGHFPDTIKGVIAEKNQFSWYGSNNNTPIDNRSWIKCVDTAILSMVLYGYVVDENVMWYHTKNTNPYWSTKMKKVATIGNHIFYKEVRGK